LRVSLEGERRLKEKEELKKFNKYRKAHPNRSLFHPTDSQQFHQKDDDEG